MDDLLSEKEQIEKMRTWWSDYGYYVIGGIVLGAIILIGFNRYQASQRDAELAASSLYDALTNHVVDGQLEDAESVIAEIETEYGDTAYAAQARLAMARLYMDKNRDQDAADVLQELVASNASEQFRQVAEVRLAKILLYQNKADEVVTLLQDKPEEGAFAARYSEALGDAYFVLGEFESARDAYRRALAEPAQAATVDQQFVQLKLLDLPAEAFAAALPADEWPADADAVDDAAASGDESTAPDEDAELSTEESE